MNKYIKCCFLLNLLIFNVDNELQAQNFYQCVACPAGTYQDGENCKNCEDGYYCIGGLKNKCSGNEKSNADRTACVPKVSNGSDSLTGGTGTNTTVCIQGTYLDEFGTCIKCPDGYWSGKGATKCGKIKYRICSYSRDPNALDKVLLKIDYLDGDKGINFCTTTFNFSEGYTFHTLDIYDCNLVKDRNRIYNGYFSFNDITMNDNFVACKNSISSLPVFNNNYYLDIQGNLYEYREYDGNEIFFNAYRQNISSSKLFDLFEKCAYGYNKYSYCAEANAKVYDRYKFTLIRSRFVNWL